MNEKPIIEGDPSERFPDLTMSQLAFREGFNRAKFIDLGIIGEHTEEISRVAGVHGVKVLDMIQKMYLKILCAEYPKD